MFAMRKCVESILGMAVIRRDDDDDIDVRGACDSCPTGCMLFPTPSLGSVARCLRNDIRHADHFNARHVRPQISTDIAKGKTMQLGHVAGADDPEANGVHVSFPSESAGRIRHQRMLRPPSTGMASPV